MKKSEELDKLIEDNREFCLKGVRITCNIVLIVMAIFVVFENLGYYGLFDLGLNFSYKGAQPGYICSFRLTNLEGFIINIIFIFIAWVVVYKKWAKPLIEKEYTRVEDEAIAIFAKRFVYLVFFIIIFGMIVSLITIALGTPNQFSGTDCPSIIDLFR